ncbi:MAG: serine hydrolase [Bacteroidota bacterium]
MPYHLLALLLFLCASCKAQPVANDQTEAIREVIASDQYPNIDGVVIARKGEIIFEAYFNGFHRNKLHDTRSSFKSVTSLLAGIAIDQGLFALEDELQTFFEDWKDDPRGKITVKDLLQMKSGLESECFLDWGPCVESDLFESEDWLQFILDVPLRHEPGLNWEYTSIEPQLVGLIIAQTSGMTIMDFARQYLFEPLEITNYEWLIDPQGRGYTAGSFNMLPRDMLKIAQLVLDNGVWEGEQIVSADWIAESTTCPTDVEMSFVRFTGLQNAKYTTANYGYFWYREALQFGDIKTEALFGSGNGGQYMMVLEEYDLALAFTGSNYGNWRGKLPFVILLRHLIPMLEGF